MIDVVEINDRIAKCEKILEGNPQSQIFAALAEVFRKKGDLDRAYEICSEGLKMHPGYSAARVVMAKIQMARKNYDQASDELERAIASGGRTRAIEVLEAEMQIHRGQKADALLTLQGLEATDPDDENVKSLLALINEKPHPDEVTLPEEISNKLEKINIENPSLSHAISILKVMPRVLGVLAVSHNGLLLDSRFDSHQVKEEFAALSKGIVDWAIQGTQRINLGRVREVMIETASSKIWIITKAKYILVVYTRDDVSIGALKLKIEELFESAEI